MHAARERRREKRSVDAKALQPSARHVQACAGHGGGGGAGRMGGVADMGALRPDAIDRPSTRLPNAPTRLLLLSSLASRLAALGWGIGARGVCAHAYERAGRHVSAALYAPIGLPVVRPPSRLLAHWQRAQRALAVLESRMYLLLPPLHLHLKLIGTPMFAILPLILSCGHSRSRSYG